MRTLFPYFLIICLAFATPGFADDESAHSQIQQWVQQLGDSSFLLRQRAEALLVRTGIQAYPELQRARQSHDVEIIRRAEYVLDQIAQAFLDVENQGVAFWIQQYKIVPDSVSKARIIWVLADPATTPYVERGYERGEGLPTLCRLVRFEENHTLRHEAAKTMIASPPILPMRRQTWYRSIRDNIHDVGGDELLQRLVRFAQLWCDLDDAEQKQTPAFQDRVHKVSAETLQLLEKPENSIQQGSKINMLLHYAVAELQDDVGLIEDRDKTVAAALAMQPEPMRESILPIDLEEGSMSEHWHVGYSLRHRFRLHWAMAHYQKVMENGHLEIRIRATIAAAETAAYLGDYSSATAFLDKGIELLESPKYKEQFNNSALRVTAVQRYRAYYLAQQAADNGNWEKVREIVTQAWTIPGSNIDAEEMDLVILAYRLCKQQSNGDQDFQKKIEQALKQMWQAVGKDHDNIPERVPNTCNSAAWLLANTDGDYQKALIFIEAALKAEPDNATYLDTLSHVYFLGGKIDEAIRTQEKVVRMAPEAVIFRRALERFKQTKELP